MDVRLSDEQAELQVPVKWIAADANAGPRLANEFANPKVSETLREALVEAGLFALLVPESAGGAGATAIEAALVAEQLRSTRGGVGGRSRLGTQQVQRNIVAQRLLGLPSK